VRFILTMLIGVCVVPRHAEAQGPTPFSLRYRVPGSHAPVAPPRPLWPALLMVVAGAPSFAIGMGVAARGGRFRGTLCIVDFGEDGCSSRRASRTNDRPLGLPVALVGAGLFAVGLPMLVRRLVLRTRWRSAQRRAEGANEQARAWAPRVELDARPSRERVYVGVELRY
jgi:hypothetical protein